MNKDVSVSTFVIILVTLILVELIILLIIIPAHNHKVLRNHCLKAFCNADATICYNYDLDGDDTIITWRGSCQGVKLK